MFCYRASASQLDMLRTKALCSASGAMAPRLPVKALRATSGLMASKRCIHARAENSPLAARTKKKTLAQESFNTPEASQFVISPTWPISKDRSQLAAPIRRAIQDAGSPAELLKEVQLAVECGEADASVFGAAMQRCGQGRWRDALQEVRALQSENRPLTAVGCSIYLAALTRCHDQFTVLHGQPAEAVIQLGQSACSEIGSSDPAVLGAGLNLCAIAKCDEGFRWGEKLWAQTPDHDDRSQMFYLRFLESHGRRARVDQLLGLWMSGPESLWKSSTLLSMLIQAAGYHNIERADHLWQMLTKSAGVQPNFLAYTAYARLLFLAGRPRTAVQLIDERLATVLEADGRAASEEIQARLVVYHSSLSSMDLRSLDQAFARYRVLQKGRGKLGQFLKSLKALKSLLTSCPRNVNLHDVLMESPGLGKISSMSSWPNHGAGTQYLLDER